MGRPPVDNKKRQLPIALDPEVRSQLEAAAAAAGRSLAEEIRLRINLTLQADERDPRDRELADDVMELAEWLRREKRFDWHSHPKARETFVDIIKGWITQSPLPRLKPQPGKPLVGASDLMWGDDDPATLARSIVRHYGRFKAEITKNTEEIRRLHERKKP